MEKIVRPYAIIFIDWDGETLKPDEDGESDFATNDISSEFYEQSGFLQWNFYLIVPRELFKPNGVNIQKFETNDKYCRKYAIKGTKIKQYITDNFPLSKEKEGKRVTLLTAKSYSQAKEKGYRLTVKLYNKLGHLNEYKYVSSPMRHYDDLKVLAIMDDLRTELINDPHLKVIYVTHLNDEIHLAEKKFKLFL